MKLLAELYAMSKDDEALNEEKKASKAAAASVYHRDYVKTKNKPYRKYDKKKENKGE